MLKKFSSKGDLPSHPNKLGQLELLPAKRPTATEISPEIIAVQSDMVAAINLAVQASGLSDKQVYDVLGIDAATFSKIRRSQAYFPACKLDALLDVVGNDIPLRWWARQRGFELKPLRSDLEKRNAALEERVRQLEHDMQVIVEYNRQVRAT